MRFDGDGRRTSFIVLLLVAVFLLSAFMAMRAQLQARYHRVTAEKVIRDWTRVTADELARRVEAQLGFYGTYPVLQAIAAAPELPRAEALVKAAATEEEKRNARLVTAVFAFDDNLRSAELSHAARSWLQPRLAAIVATSPDREPLHTTLGGATKSFVYMPTRQKGLVGFEVDRNAMGTFFGQVLVTRPLMPASLADGRLSNDVLAVRVRGDDNRVLFATDRAVDTDAAVTLPIKEGLLRGFSIDLSIAPDVAPLLVFGGVPRPLPIYLIVLSLSGALLLVAALQLQKERAIARMRSEFIASVSHELRTPLTQIRMFAETLLLDRVRSEEERRRSLTIIDQETRRLAHIVENVMQFSRGQRGALNITRRNVDIGSVVRETVETFLPIAKGRGVSIEVDVPGELFVNVDEEAIRQVVLNLLDNAVKYGPEAQRVRIEIRRHDDRVKLSVTDEGPGIPQGDRKRVWLQYERLERDRTRAIAGAGIGLSVVRELVALHGGRVSVESDGRGSRFIVEVPA